ncbi:Hypothetical protein, putative [Bodo saltans]|uniref:Uncharacterized protein n=1 Tax=Bodo saltans TaxID=75058 RepID=A0A0S4KKV8_BODSA|nr:Hypothetical protein, putative [Bodo saltans]|eukprot:CUI15211.1 Hypothetical protein, putative [Bodo saltans]
MASHSIETRFALEVRESGPHVLVSTPDVPFSALITNIRFQPPRPQPQKKNSNKSNDEAKDNTTDGDVSTVYSLVMVGAKGKVQEEFTLASFEHQVKQQASAASSSSSTAIATVPQPISINTQLVLTSKSPIQQIQLRSSRPRKGAKRDRDEADKSVSAKAEACVYLTGVQLTTLSAPQVEALVR